MVHLLPPVLQPFFNEETRRKMPENLTVYDNLYELLLMNAGHPRRMETLFKNLQAFSFTLSKSTRSDCTDFAVKIKAWLD